MARKDHQVQLDSLGSRVQQGQKAVMEFPEHLGQKDHKEKKVLVVCKEFPVLQEWMENMEREVLLDQRVKKVSQDFKVDPVQEDYLELKDQREIQVHLDFLEIQENRGQVELKESLVDLVMMAKLEMQVPLVILV